MLNTNRPHFSPFQSAEVLCQALWPPQGAMHLEAKSKNPIDDTNTALRGRKWSLKHRGYRQRRLCAVPVDSDEFQHQGTVAAGLGFSNDFKDLTDMRKF